jgi:hypothetical protein
MLSARGVVVLGVRLGEGGVIMVNNRHGGCGR